jgi:hypothetical protein
VKLLLDEMLSPALAGQLRALGCDVDAVAERAELRGVDDLKQFEHAQDERRVFVTYDREDLLAVDRWFRQAGREHHGLVIVNARRFPPGPASAGALVRSLDAFAAGDPPYPGFVHWLQ